LAALAATFAIEYFLSFDPITRRLGPSLKTLEMLGGLNWSLVVYSGEWYRLLTAAFLHADPMHFAANAFVLLLAGMILERVVGHAWLAVLFFVSALTGSLASLAWNPIETIGIGSSGAIMGILAAAFVCSFHFHPGSEQTGLRLTAIQVLIPSLLPYFSGKSDVSIDYAAHLGGALGGSVVALIILMTWRPQTPWPSLRTAAAVVSAGFVLMSAASALPIIANYSSAKERATSRSGAPQTQSHYQNYLADLVPAAEWPPDLATQKASVRDLRFRYPNDPRVRYASGLAYLDADDYAAAERELKAALANRTNLASFYGLEESVRSYLSIVLYGQGKLSEARGIAAPLCRGVKSAGQAAVRDLGLCL
jgi:rhomboid protease GluP